MNKEGAYVYIMGNSLVTVIYIGVTNNLPNRVHQHKYSFGSTFTHKHGCKNLFYFEYFDSMDEAVKRSEYLKSQSHSWIEDFIKQHNAKMKDLTNQISNSF